MRNREEEILSYIWLLQCLDNGVHYTFFNMEVRLPGGRSYSLNVWTYGMLERARQADGKTREHLGGAYLLPTCSWRGEIAPCWKR